MNKIAIYQHPYVDVFKVQKILDCNSVTDQKEGDVQKVWDKGLAKNVLSINGTSTASNYVCIPAAKHVPKNCLGLIGKFVYFALKCPQAKNFVIHCDFMVNEARHVKVSLSNIYKTYKDLNGLSIQCPLELQPEKWNMIQIDLMSLFDGYGVFMPDKPKEFYMRSMQICCSCDVKGVYTSDMNYTVATLPKDMQLRVPRNVDWSTLYDWVRLAHPNEPAPPVQQEKPQQDKPQKRGIAARPPSAPHAQNENIQANDQQNLQSVTKKSNLRKQSLNKSGSTKSVKFGQSQVKKPNADLEEIATKGTDSKAKTTGKVPPTLNNLANKKQKTEEAKKQSKIGSGVLNNKKPPKQVTKDTQVLIPSEQDQKQSIEQEQTAKLGPTQSQATIWQQDKHQAVQDYQQSMAEPVQQTLQQIDEIKRTYDQQLHSAQIKSSASVTLFQQSMLYDPNKTRQQNGENFQLKPEPIIKLQKVIGMNTRKLAPCLQFSKDLKNSNDLYYCQANMLIALNSKKKTQRIFYSPDQDAVIENMIITRGYAFLVSHGYVQGKTPTKQQCGATITIWDLHVTHSPFFTFKTGLNKCKQLVASEDGTMLAMHGRDTSNRDTLMVYDLQKLLQEKEVGLIARQLCDFELNCVIFNKFSNPPSLVGCGKENVRFYVIKSEHLPGQLIALNNTARGKVFTHALAVNEFVYVSTDDGLLYCIKHKQKQLHQILQLHEAPLSCLETCKGFSLTSAVDGSVRIWTPNFQKLLSQVDVTAPILAADISLDEQELCLICNDGCIGVVSLESCSYQVIMRSHTQELIDMTYNKLTGTIVTIGKDGMIKLWHADTMEQLHEFSLGNPGIDEDAANRDLPSCVKSSLSEATVVVGFNSGFIRVFDMSQRTLVYESMIFESTVKDIDFSENGKFMAVVYQQPRLIIFNSQQNFQPVKNIEWPFGHEILAGVAFSQDSEMVANISSNANTISVWDTTTFSLKAQLELMHDNVVKIQFAPNTRDLVALTHNSKLKFFRLENNQVIQFRDYYGACEMAARDFTISGNCKYIAVAGEEGTVRIYDYFMRGEPIACCQVFKGHLQYPLKLNFSPDSKTLYSIGAGNGLFVWQFFGDTSVPDDLLAYYEPLKQHEQTGNTQQQQLSEGQSEVEQIQQTYTEQQIAQMKQAMADNLNLGYTQSNFGAQAIQRPNEIDYLQESNFRSTFGNATGPITSGTTQLLSVPEGYSFESYDMELKKVLACSIAPKVRNNVVWNKKQGYIAYTIQNIVIVEWLNEQKTQKLLKEGRDIISKLILSKDGKHLLAFSEFGIIEGNPLVVIWDATTLRQTNQFAIEDKQLINVQFSALVNMLLVLSSNGLEGSDARSTVAVWDFLDGTKDYFAKSTVPMKINDACWNTYTKNSCDEWVTVCDRKYHYWRMTEQLQIQYQEGMYNKDGETWSSHHEKLTTICFAEPMLEQNSVYMLIGTSEGNIWVLDTRCNYFLYKTKVLSCPVRNIISTLVRIVVEGTHDTEIHSWDIKKTINDWSYDASDPNYFFAGQEKKLSIDGYPSASAYDETAAESIIVSTSGSIWYFSWLELASVKLKSCHKPDHAIAQLEFRYIPPAMCTQAHQNASEFDMNYMVASAADEGLIKLWNLYDLEQQMQFVIPQERCMAIAMHQFKPYMVCSYTDGYVRFFDIESSKSMGRCSVSPAQEEANVHDYVNQLRFLPSGNQILMQTKSGQIILLFIENWNPLSVLLENVVSLNTSLHQLQISQLEPYNKWLTGTCNGKVVVYTRKDGNAFEQQVFDTKQMPKFVFMDSFNVLDFVDNSFVQTTKSNTLDHYYSLSKKNLVHNESVWEHECEAMFMPRDLTTYLCFIRKCNYLFVRNFELHQVVKKIELNMPLKSLQMGPQSSAHVLILLSDNSIKMLDYVNETNCCTIETIHDTCKLFRLSPNGRYLLTAGDKGDIVVYQINRRNINQQHDQLY